MLNLEELITVHETKEHIDNVRKFIFKICYKLHLRGIDHDKSKLVEPELSVLGKFTPKLAKTTYGSEKYKEFLREMRPALDHHYSKNRHHPEYFYPEVENDEGKDEISCMNLVDLVEMICDWKAATMRHNDGDLNRSIEVNAKRFNLSDQLKSILVNTIKILEE